MECDKCSKGTNFHSEPCASCLTTPEIYYRYEDPRSEFEWIALRKYRVIKHTPKGVWVEVAWNTKKLVLHNSRKKFANPTQAGALYDFKRRKLRQKEILSGRIYRINHVLKLIEEIEKGILRQEKN